MTPEPIHGSCLCGAVAYAITGPINRFMQCHCSRCRKRTGSAFASNLFVEPDSLRWIRGEEKVVRYDLPSAERFATVFCRTCGSPVPHLARDGSAYIIAAGSLDEDPNMTPQRIIYWASRAPWFVHTDTLETSDAGL